ncbi:MAG: hypothetical protein ABSF13_13860 [Smithella sp.]|jgi:hypothetical protein
MEKKGEYQISSSVNNGILEVVLTGKAIDMTYKKMGNEVDDIIKANNAKKAIIDVRALEGRIEHTEIYHYVRNHSSFIYEIQAAVVDLPENAHYATAVKNAGLSFTWFTDIDAARKWIKRKSKKM